MTKRLLWNLFCRCPARGRLMFFSRLIFRFKQNFQYLSGHMIKCLLTELGRAGQENICLSVKTYGPRAK